ARTRRGWIHPHRRRSQDAAEVPRRGGRDVESARAVEGPWRRVQRRRSTADSVLRVLLRRWQATPRAEQHETTQVGLPRRAVPINVGQFMGPHFPRRGAPARGGAAGTHTPLIEILGRNNELTGATVDAVTVDAFVVY